MDTKMNKKHLLNGWSVCVGFMDAITGILLIFVPELVLKVLGIADPEHSSWVFLSWMGVFVSGVGLSYVWGLGNATQGRLVWKFTAMIRLMVAGFISWKIGIGELQPAWLLVALSDAFVAVIQLVVLRLDWWREVDP
jgi:hypothetical protein